MRIVCNPKKIFSTIIAGMILISVSTEISTYNLSGYVLWLQNFTNSLFSYQPFYYLKPEILLRKIKLFTSFWSVKSKKKSFDLAWGLSERQGKRKTMENRCVVITEGEEKFYSLLDGHGGIAAADYAKEYLIKNFNNSNTRTTEAKLREAFRRTNANFLSNPQFQTDQSGTTAVVAVINSNTQKLTIANCGDSRAILIRNGKIIFYTQDHKPNNLKERARIKRARGSVPIRGPKKDYVSNGKNKNYFLAVSRSIGDRKFKKFGIIATPDISEQDLQKDDILVLACDGVWDEMNNETVAAFILNQLNKKNENLNAENAAGAREDNKLKQTAQALVNEAYNRGSTDNMSALIVQV